VTEDEKPSDANQNAHGMLPTEPLDGQGLTPSALQVLMQQALTMEAMAYALDRMAAQNHELMDRLLPEDDEQDDNHSHGRDMAGNPIKVS
jgi:hypothetical protein